MSDFGVYYDVKYDQIFVADWLLHCDVVDLEIVFIGVL